MFGNPYHRLSIVAQIYSIITVDTTISQGITVKRWHVNKYSHEYIVFSKTASSTPYFLHVGNIMAPAGSDLGVYPTNFKKY